MSAEPFSQGFERGIQEGSMTKPPLLFHVRNGSTDPKSTGSESLVSCGWAGVVRPAETMERRRVIDFSTGNSRTFKSSSASSCGEQGSVAF